MLPTLTERHRLQHGYKEPYEEGIRKASFHAHEHMRWLIRVDEAVDELVNTHGLDVPYQPNTEYCKENEVRYNPAYRLEMAVEQLKAKYRD